MYYARFDDADGDMIPMYRQKATLYIELQLNSSNDNRWSKCSIREAQSRQDRNSAEQQTHDRVIGSGE